MTKGGIILQERKDCLGFLNTLKKQNWSAFLAVPNQCPPNFDGSLCWNISTPAFTMSRQCPFEFCDQCPLATPERSSRRHCFENGSWAAPDYTACVRIFRDFPRCIATGCIPCPDTFRDVVKYTSICLSLLSVALLLISLILFSVFKNLQCRRLSIHKNLAAAFVCRFFFFAVWTILQSMNAFKDCDRFHAPVILHLNWLCKTVLWLVIYFQVASVFWMLVEGSYLISRFTILAMRHGEGPYWIYLSFGWGVPLVTVSCWTVLHEIHSRENNLYCWIPYAEGNRLWILAGTMGAALILNLLFLLGIVVILVRKLWAQNSAESKKIWKTIKATLLLVPLLGISNIPLFYEPNKKHAVYMLISTILQHSQGIFIAVLYCFLNSEIQEAIKRQVRSLPFYEALRRKQTAMSMGVSEYTTAYTSAPLNKDRVRQASPRRQTEENNADDLNLDAIPETAPLSDGKREKKVNYKSYEDLE